MKSKYFLLLLSVIVLIGGASYFFIQDKKPSEPDISSAILTTKPDLIITQKAETKSIDVFQANIFDYTKVKNTVEKKQVFFDTLRPIVFNQNRKIDEQRQKVLTAQKNNDAQPWIMQLADKYNVDWDHMKPDWSSLLKRIDTIPNELVLAQAANESAWGKSRFAQKANNLFGQWCFRKGCGIVPKDRNSGANHEVRKFSSINDSVASYMHNLNTGHAYKELRNLRAKLRSSNKNIDGHILAKGLEKYSSRGIEYVKEIQSMIKTNKSLM